MKSKKSKPPRPVLGEHMPVVLKRSLPSLELKGGTFGVIVHVYPTGDTYEVEFFRFDGTSVGVATVKASSVSPVRRTVPILTSKQEAFLSAITDSKQFSLEKVLARHATVRPVPPLTPGQIAFHGGLADNPSAFSLAKVTATAKKLAEPKNANLFTKEAAHAAFAHLKGVSVARTLADASAALKAGTLKQLTSPPAQVSRLRVRTLVQPDFEPITDAQYAVLEKAAPRARGKVISSVEDMLTPPAPLLQLQLANDFAVLLCKERGQQAAVQHLYNGIGQSSVATLLGVKKCP